MATASVAPRVPTSANSDHERRQVQPGACGGDRRVDEDVGDPETHRTASVAGQDGAGRQDEIGPPQPEDQSDPGDDDDHRLHAPALLAHECGDGGDGSEQHFAEGDDREQPVPLRDVVRMPRGAAEACLDQRRAGDFDDEEHGCGDDDDAQREIREGDEHPSDLATDTKPAYVSAAVRCAGTCTATRHHCTTSATRITTYPATMTPLSTPWPPSTEAKNAGMPSANTITPIICTIVVVR